jgi:hypothetical protein
MTQPTWQGIEYQTFFAGSWRRRLTPFHSCRLKTGVVSFGVALLFVSDPVCEAYGHTFFVRGMVAGKIRWLRAR